MSNYTLPHSGAVLKISNFGNRTVVDVRNIYQALRVFQKFEPEPLHLGAMASSIGVSHAGPVQVTYKDLRCRVDGVHPGLGSIDFQGYGYALAVARQLAEQYDDLVFITESSTPITNSILHEDGVIEPIKPWQYYFSQTARPTEINQEHMLVNKAKEAFMAIHMAYDKVQHEPIDAKDVVYQCLFRLFSMSPRDYILKGEIVQKEWAGINYHELATDEVTFDQNILHYIYFEQLSNLLSRYYKPEAKLFADLSNIFGNPKERGYMTTAKGIPYYTQGSEKVPITIKEVESDLAQRIHGSFHYIHTPRNKGYALGLYLEGMKLPFSVLAIEKVDREYKKSALEKYNLSYKHTYEVTRLYSAPNTPLNNSSFILSLASSYLRTNDKSWQATLSSFMPSYATGASMLSGGFEQMLFAKPCHHFYEPGTFGLMARTNRTSDALVRVANRTAIMPVVELISTRPRVFEAIKQDKLLTLTEGTVI
jgi:hypothetical protein